MKNKDKKDKILLNTPKFNVTERDGKPGIVATVETVMLLPFITDDNGLPLMLGVLKERNLFREGGYCTSLITGTCEDEDPDYLETAKRELKEESGYDVPDNDKWYYLGTVTATKFVDKEYPCFAIDVTGIEKGEASTDGSKQERLSSFHFIPANDVVKSKDVFIPALFLKLFKFVVGMDLYNRDDSVFGQSKGFSADI
jgi:8-oxo-dGTP pyrophosphatase MutT (NUDIX family)